MTDTDGTKMKRKTDYVAHQKIDNKLIIYKLINYTDRFRKIK